jgi:hypothetical protein
MSKTIYTPELICELREQYGAGNMFQCDPAATKTNSNKNYPTYYIPFTCVTKTEARSPLIYQFKKQIVGASSKVAHGQNAKEARDVRVLYKLLDKDDFEGSEYNEESYSAAKKEELVKYNKLHIKALTIIHEEYLAMVNTQIIPYDGSSFTMPKNKVINSFAQYERKASDSEKAANEKLPKAEKFVKAGKVALPKPLFRIKLSVMDDRRIGYKTKDTPFIPLVYDVRKLTKENKYTPVPAKVLSGKKLTDLTINNVGSFITYMSQSSGKIKFADVCLSSSGISLSNSFYEIHIAPHKKMEHKSFSSDDLEDMMDTGLVNRGDIEEVIDEPVEKKSSKKPFKPARAAADDDDAEEYLDDENEPAADGEEEEDQEPVKPVKPVKPAKPAKPIKPAAKPVESEEEPEEDQEPEEPEEPEETVEEPKKPVAKKAAAKAVVEKPKKPVAKKVTRKVKQVEPDETD